MTFWHRRPGHWHEWQETSPRIAWRVAVWPFYEGE